MPPIVAQGVNATSGSRSTAEHPDHSSVQIAFGFPQFLVPDIIAVTQLAKPHPVGEAGKVRPLPTGSVYGYRFPFRAGGETAGDRVAMALDDCHGGLNRYILRKTGWPVVAELPRRFPPVLHVTQHECQTVVIEILLAVRMVVAIRIQERKVRLDLIPSISDLNEAALFSPRQPGGAALDRRRSRKRGIRIGYRLKSGKPVCRAVAKFSEQQRHSRFSHANNPKVRRMNDLLGNLRKVLSVDAPLVHQQSELAA